MLFKMLLKPFVSAVVAFVRVLEFLDINDNWSAAFLDEQDGAPSELA